MKMAANLRRHPLPNQSLRFVLLNLFSRGTPALGGSLSADCRPAFSRYHSFVSLQRLLNQLGRNRSLPPNAPLLPTQFHNRRRRELLRLASIQDQRNSVSQLLHHFLGTR